MFGTRLSAQASPQVDSGSIKVQAAGNIPVVIVQPTPMPQIATHPAPAISPFDLTRTVSLVILGIFTIVLAADIFLVNRKSIVRWTSKSLAHLIFIAILIIAAAAIIRGQIL